MSTTTELSLSELEVACTQWVTKEWSSNDDQKMFHEATQAIALILAPLKPVKPDDYCGEFLTRLITHENWKHRAWAVILFDSFMASKALRYVLKKEDWIKINDQFWQRITDPERRVVEFLFRTKAVTEFYRYSEGIGSLEIKGSLDLTPLVAQVPHITPEIRGHYFWILVSIVYTHFYKKEALHLLRPHLENLFNYLIQVEHVGPKGVNMMELYSDALDLWLEFPPEPDPSEWGRLAAYIYSGSYIWININTNEIIKRIIPGLIQSQDEDVLREFLRACDHDAGFIEVTTWENYKGAFWARELLFKEAIHTHWFAGARFILRSSVVLTSSAYISGSASAQGITDYFGNVTGRMTLTYVNSEGEITLPLIQRLYILWKYSRDARSLPKPKLQTALIQLGQRIERHQQHECQTYCLEQPFILPLQGMLDVATELNDQERLLQLVTAFLDTYKQIWLPDTHPDFPNWWNRKRDEPPLFLPSGDPKKHFELGLKLPVQREDCLQLLSSTLYPDPKNPALLGRVLKHLYLRYGIWISRFLFDTLHYLFSYTSALRIIEPLGALWTSISSVPPSSESEGDTWVHTVLQASAAKPEVYPELVRHIQEESQPFIRRILAITLLTRFGAKSIPILAEQLHSDHPQIRRSGTLVLGTIQDSRCYPLLEARLQDPDQDVQTAAVIALGNLNDRRIIPRLLDLQEEITTKIQTITHELQANWFEISKFEHSIPLIPQGTMEQEIESDILVPLHRTKVTIEAILQQFDSQ